MSKEINKVISYAAGFYTRSFEDFVSYAVDAGFSGVQFIPDQSPNLCSEFSVARTRKLCSQLKDAGITPVVHNVFYDINLCSIVPEVSEFARFVTSSVLQFSKDIGAATLTVHPGYMYPGWRNDPHQNAVFWSAAIENMKQLVELAANHEIKILLENGSYCLGTRLYEHKTEFHLGIDISELEKLITLSNFEAGVCMDIGKLRASGIAPQEFINQLGPFICEIQVSRREDFEFVGALMDKTREEVISVVFEGRDPLERECFLNWKK